MTDNKKILEKSGLNDTFNAENMCFNTYVESTRAMIEQARLDLTDDNREHIIDANSPYEWLPKSVPPKAFPLKKYKKGILLVHGLYDSPYTLLSLAQYYHEQNFLVRTILLPGHGTRPGDLVGVSYEQWVKAVKYAVDSFETEVEELYLAGFSTGGALVIHAALFNKIQNLKGLILFAPALKLLRPIAIISNIDRLLRSTTIGGIKWFTKTANDDYAKYGAFTLDSANEVNQLSHVILKKLKTHTLDCPIFQVATQDDEVLSLDAMIEFCNQNRFLQSQMYIYGNRAKTYANKKITTLAASYPRYRILNFSHMCLPIAPCHPHYGLNGDYHGLIHHEEDPKTGLKVVSEKPFYGAVTHANLKKHLMTRLTFNPDFDNLTKRLTKWHLAISHSNASRPA